MADSFVMQPSYYDGLCRYKNDADKVLLFSVLCEYGLYEKEPSDNLPPFVLSYYDMVRPTIDASKSRRKTNSENGKKGGAPKGNQNASKQPKTSENNQEIIENNLNDNVNVDVNFNENVDGNGDGVVNDNASEKPRPHGRFQNVFLSDSEFEQLKGEFFNIDSTIERLSEYMASKGRTYDNHYATLCKWAREDSEKAHQKSNNKTAQQLDDFYNMANNWAADETPDKVQYGTYL